MKKDKLIKLTLYKNFQEVNAITEIHTEEGFKKLVNLAEKWKAKNVTENTINITFLESDKNDYN